ncbi:hypothetical protein QLH52_11835 [Methylomonas sp. OY6]|uniref:Uncharacterized protein n=1 Tax=Methylomonas defluvii TaxID=3045149 RepID=A0ABU4UGM5_9GAMM|nr:hypothetical protein [Methylomonas sp. OY6]MDX8127975.1 hypothetical protein [Methylomonas sp. OY6]
MLINATAQALHGNCLFCADKSKQEFQLCSKLAGWRTVQGNPERSEFKPGIPGISPVTVWLDLPSSRYCCERMPAPLEAV